MRKDTFFTGQPILGQLLSLIPRYKVDLLSQKYHSTCSVRRVKRSASTDYNIPLSFRTQHNDLPCP
ncbi:hypothetical protein [Pedobacter rhizosphaerae]|uniref:DUF4372 domain-containing protein n=1 Tax=Pedobacter rhizosphaerae TaxID=390241 RepID=A0A1H9QEV0_9SPHI|nr:hypothetical protein [Pedobacter rhizosphaerae]SER58962.1 hypothetical protein SAMN04488023_111170 [Pedobacter rhizosphaerae]